MLKDLLIMVTEWLILKQVIIIIYSADISFLFLKNVA